jgi:hypothetical protein
MKTVRSLGWSALALAAISGTASAQTSLSYTTAASVYSNNFDSPTLLNTGSGNAWNNNTPPTGMSGWSAWRAGSSGVSGVRDSTTTGQTAYGADAGTATTGGIFSFGSSGSTERAFGSQATNTTGDLLIMFAVLNNTGVTLTQFTFGWDFEQWRNNGNTAAHSLVLDYSVRTNNSFTSGLSSLNDASFTTGFTAPGGNWNGTSVVNTATAAAVDGNVAGLVAGRGGTVTGISWAPNTLLIIRFWDDNNTGNDHSLGIDNVTFSAVPTPGSALLAGVGLLAAARRRRA